MAESVLGSRPLLLHLSSRPWKVDCLSNGGRGRKGPRWITSSSNSDPLLKVSSSSSSLPSKMALSVSFGKAPLWIHSTSTSNYVRSRYKPNGPDPFQKEKSHPLFSALLKTFSFISIVVTCNYGYAYFVFVSALKNGLGDATDSSGIGGSGNSTNHGGGGGGGGGGGDINSNGGGNSNDGFHPKLESNLLVTEPEDESKPDVFIVIPALNEASCIQNTLKHISKLHLPPRAVIVVDGGSTDGTVQVASEESAIVVKSDKGRAVQMNAGAKKALSLLNGRDGILCFVHADTKVPYDLVKVVRTALEEDKEVICGGFIPKVISIDDQILWFMSLQNVSKTWYGSFLYNPVKFFRGLRCLFGDQAMFCRASDLKAVGYFDENLLIMEDADLCLRLHEMGRSVGENRAAKGKIKMVPRIIETSGRRLQKWGPTKSTYIHLRIALAYVFGLPPDQINALYKKLYSEIR